MGVLLIHEPSAGEDPWPADRLLALLAGAGFEADHRSVGDDDFEAALGRARRLVVAAGGDGTAARVATALPDRSVPLLILPMGSANNVSRSLEAFGAVEDVVAGIEGAEAVPLGVGVVVGRWGTRRFVEAVGIGALARTVSMLQDAKLDGDRKRETGRETLRQAVEAAAPVRAHVTVDGETADEPSLLFEALNVAMVGANLRLGPAERLSGDAFCVATLPLDGRDAFLRWLDAPEGPAPLRRRSARVVTVEAPHEPLRIDDKTVEWDGSRIELRLEPEPVRVLAPRRPT